MNGENTETKPDSEANKDRVQRLVSSDFKEVSNQLANKIFEAGYISEEECAEMILNHLNTLDELPLHSNATMPIRYLNRPLAVGDSIKTKSGDRHTLSHEHGDELATSNYFYRWCKYNYTIEHAAMADDDAITHIFIS